jgi:hypothetical protein
MNNNILYIFLESHQGEKYNKYTREGWTPGWLIREFLSPDEKGEKIFTLIRINKHE